MGSEVNRPLADFPANIWENLLTSFSKSDFGSETFREKHSLLKEVVKESFVASQANLMENIKFIDALCRLGVSYHFDKDIIEQLQKSFGSPDFNHTISHSDSMVKSRIRSAREVDKSLEEAMVNWMQIRM